MAGEEWSTLDVFIFLNFDFSLIKEVDHPPQIERSKHIAPHCNLYILVKEYQNGWNGDENEANALYLASMVVLL